jgi:hypothetical protein
MSLTVEVAGFGLCQTITPYSVLVICVQQEQFQAWTVYRRYNSFLALAEQLQILHPNIPSVPRFESDNLSIDILESCRVSMDRWLQSITSNPMILRTQSMYQFLCVDANMPPPYLEIHWRNGNNGSFDEMEMDDMFEKHLDENEIGMDSESAEEGDPDWEEQEVNEEEDLTAAGGVAKNEEDTTTGNVPATAWGAGGQGQPIAAKNSTTKKSAAGGAGGGAGGSGGSANKKQVKMTGNGGGGGGDEDDEKDGLDIQSLSVMEAEFLYNRVDEGKSAAEVAQSKKTINLEAFHIIKVIGKGD